MSFGRISTQSVLKAHILSNESFVKICWHPVSSFFISFDVTDQLFPVYPCIQNHKRYLVFNSQMMQRRLLISQSLWLYLRIRSINPVIINQYSSSQHSIHIRTVERLYSLYGLLITTVPAVHFCRYWLVHCMLLYSFPLLGQSAVYYCTTWRVQFTTLYARARDC